MILVHLAHWKILDNNALHKFTYLLTTYLLTNNMCRKHINYAKVCAGYDETCIARTHSESVLLSKHVLQKSTTFSQCKNMKALITKSLINYSEENVWSSDFPQMACNIIQYENGSYVRKHMIYAALENMQYMLQCLLAHSLDWVAVVEREGQLSDGWTWRSTVWWLNVKVNCLMVEREDQLSDGWTWRSTVWWLNVKVNCLMVEREGQLSDSWTWRSTVW